MHARVDPVARHSTAQRPSGLGGSHASRKLRSNSCRGCTTCGDRYSASDSMAQNASRSPISWSRRINREVSRRIMWHRVQMTWPGVVDASRRRAGRQQRLRSPSARATWRPARPTLATISRTEPSYRQILRQHRLEPLPLLVSSKAGDRVRVAPLRRTVGTALSRLAFGSPFPVTRHTRRHLIALE